MSELIRSVEQSRIELWQAYRKGIPAQWNNLHVDLPDLVPAFHKTTFDKTKQILESGHFMALAGKDTLVTEPLLMRHINRPGNTILEFAVPESWLCDPVGLAGLTPGNFALGGRSPYLPDIHSYYIPSKLVRGIYRFNPKDPASWTQIILFSHPKVGS